jgi:hypothetical protein
MKLFLQVNNYILLFAVKAFSRQRECSHARNLKTSARPFLVCQSPHNITANYTQETSHHNKTRPTSLTAHVTEYSTHSTSSQQKRLCPKLAKIQFGYRCLSIVSNPSNGANSNYASAVCTAPVTRYFLANNYKYNHISQHTIDTCTVRCSPIAK